MLFRSIINFKNINDNKIKTQTKFYNSSRINRDEDFEIQKINDEEQSPDNKLSLSGSVTRYNTQYINNIRFKSDIITPLSPINKKDLFPKFIKEKACDVSFIASNKRRNSSDSLVITNNINTLFKHPNTSLNQMTLSPKLKSVYNIMNNNLTNIFSTQNILTTL